MLLRRRLRRRSLAVGSRKAAPQSPVSPSPFTGRTLHASDVGRSRGQPACAEGRVSPYLICESIRSESSKLDVLDSSRSTLAGGSVPGIGLCSHNGDSPGMSRGPWRWRTYTGWAAVIDIG